MITKELLNPKSIVVIGASNDIEKPGGKVLKNLIDGNFPGKLYAVNPKQSEIQGIKTFQNVNELPNVDLAIIAIAAKHIPDTVEILAKEKKTKAFIVISAGFSEENEEGAKLEKRLVKIVNRAGASLIGPNCTGVLTPNYHGIFTLPIPKLESKGCDFISGSGATACFIMESGIPKGVTFSKVFTVGNSAQLGVEEILEYLDISFNPKTDSKVKMLYIETINKPRKLLKHASSLIRKGCRIVAVKAGSSTAGSRAASSHTGALASSDSAVDALFEKAGIVRCHGRDDLISVASVFMYPKLKGKNIAVITHAGGPGVMLTDALSNGGMNVPQIKGKKAQELLSELFPGSSVANPIDFLATGTKEQLGTIIDYVENEFDEIDGMAVIFGTPGLTKLFEVYDLLDKKMKKCRKPIYPVLPSILTAKEEIENFISKGQIIFTDETVLGNALTKIYNILKAVDFSKKQVLKSNSKQPDKRIKINTLGYTPSPVEENYNLPSIDKNKIRSIIDNSSDGYLIPDKVSELLDCVGINRAEEIVVSTKNKALEAAEKLGFPLVMKVVGPVHKSDVGGVCINIKNAKTVEKEFDRMMKIKDTESILFQPMLSGIELFAGAKYEPKFGHLILCGLGGIFIEVLKDVSTALAPVSKNEASDMIKKLKAYKIIQGIRGSKGVNEDKFSDVMIRLSALLNTAPEIVEMDLNPLLGTPEKITAVDARVRIEKRL